MFNEEDNKAREALGKFLDIDFKMTKRTHQGSALIIVDTEIPIPEQTQNKMKEAVRQALNRNVMLYCNVYGQ